MRLLISSNGGHADLASAVSWACSSDIYTCSDDQSVQRWSPQGKNVGKVCSLESAILDLHCNSAGAKRQQGSTEAVFAVACSDGFLRLIHTNGKLEKAVEAHRGAVLCVRWSPDGNAIATSGEDGQVKIWSRAGMLRSTILQSEDPVYCLAWVGSAGSQLLVCSGSTVSIRPLQGVASGPAAAAASNQGITGPRGSSATTSSVSSSNSVQASWKAHDGIVLTADWNATSGLIVTGGEDCRYKIWNPFGRLLYCSSPWEHSITSTAWSPAGTLLAVGSFNCLALCDGQGWSYCQARHKAGSLLGLCWSPDATRVAAAGSTGSLLIAAVLEAVVEDGRYAATLTEQNVVTVSDMLSETTERLEFKGPVVKMSIGFGHLVVCTSSHCYVYATSNFNTPNILDLKEQPQLVLQCGRGFGLLDATSGLQVFTYDERQVCAFRPLGLNPEGVSGQLISLSNDTVAAATGCSVCCYEAAQGRMIGEVLTFNQDVKAVCLSQTGVATGRLLAVLDGNGDLFLVRQLASTGLPTAAVAAARPAAGSGGGVASAGVITAGGLITQQGGSASQQQQRVVKLATNVSSAPVWSDSAPMLAAVVDAQLMVWIHPAAAFVDQQLLRATRVVISTDSSVGAGTSLERFSGSSLALRRRDGARVFASITPQPALLHELVRQGRWDKAVQLARFSHDIALWSCLAALSMAAGELATAEVAFAAIDAVDKLRFVQHLRGLSGPRGASSSSSTTTAAAATGDPLVAAELLVYVGQLEEAEAKLLQAGLVYRAVKLHVRMHNWQRALDLASKHQQHVDTVLWHRQRYLAAVGQAETLPAFKARMQEGVQLDEAAIKAAVAADKAKETQQRAVQKPTKP